MEPIEEKVNSQQKKIWVKLLFGREVCRGIQTVKNSIKEKAIRKRSQLLTDFLSISYQQVRSKLEDSASYSKTRNKDNFI